MHDFVYLTFFRCVLLPDRNAFRVSFPEHMQGQSHTLTANDEHDKRQWMTSLRSILPQSQIKEPSSKSHQDPDTVSITSDVTDHSVSPSSCGSPTSSTSSLGSFVAASLADVTELPSYNTSSSSLEMVDDSILAAPSSPDFPRKMTLRSSGSSLKSTGSADSHVFQALPDLPKIQMTTPVNPMPKARKCPTQLYNCTPDPRKQSGNLSLVIDASHSGSTLGSSPYPRRPIQGRVAPPSISHGRSHTISSATTTGKPPLDTKTRRANFFSASSSLSSSVEPYTTPCSQPLSELKNHANTLSK